MAGRYSKWAKLIYFLGDRWSALNLAGQFAVAALVVLGCGMAVFGMWVVSRI